MRLFQQIYKGNFSMVSFRNKKHFQIQHNNVHQRNLNKKVDCVSEDIYRLQKGKPQNRIPKKDHNDHILTEGYVNISLVCPTSPFQG